MKLDGVSCRTGDEGEYSAAAAPARARAATTARRAAGFRRCILPLPLLLLPGGAGAGQTENALTEVILTAVYRGGGGRVSRRIRIIHVDNTVDLNRMCFGLAEPTRYRTRPLTVVSGRPQLRNARKIGILFLR